MVGVIGSPIADIDVVTDGVRAYVACRCGAKHQPREHTVPCSYCGTPTWDHHAVCARCRPAETFELHADAVAAVVDEHEAGCAACRVVGPLLTAPGTSGRTWTCACGAAWTGEEPPS